MWITRVTDPSLPDWCEKPAWESQCQLIWKRHQGQFPGSVYLSFFNLPLYSALKLQFDACSDICSAVLYTYSPNFPIVVFQWVFSVPGTNVFMNKKNLLCRFLVCSSYTMYDTSEPWLFGPRKRFWLPQIIMLQVLYMIHYTKPGEKKSQFPRWRILG